jgi:hypothetical protein
MDWNWIIWILIVAAFAIRAWLKDLKRSENLKMSGIRTQGIVVRNKFCWGRMCVTRPIIQFQTQQGKTIEALDQNGAALAVPRFSKGTRVMLIYKEEDPTDFDISSEGNLFS